MILASSSPVSLLLAIAAAVAYAIPAVAARQLQDRGARAALWLAWALHAALLGWSMLETTPRFGFAPALSVTAWLVLTVYAIEHQLFPQLQARWARRQCHRHVELPRHTLPSPQAFAQSGYSVLSVIFSKTRWGGFWMVIE